MVMRSTFASRAAGLGTRPVFGRLALSSGILACMSLMSPVARLQAETRVQQVPMEVTTDTPEYCQRLADRVHDLVRDAEAKPPREVADLSVEGQKMCEQGQTRGGILRLRQAILIMKHDDPSIRH